VAFMKLEQSANRDDRDGLMLALVPRTSLKQLSALHLDRGWKSEEETVFTARPLRTTLENFIVR
jgi:hypothetical protein